MFTVEGPGGWGKGTRTIIRDQPDIGLSLDGIAVDRDTWSLLQACIGAELPDDEAYMTRGSLVFTLFKPCTRCVCVCVIYIYIYICLGCKGNRRNTWATRVLESHRWKQQPTWAFDGQVEVEETSPRNCCVSGCTRFPTV